MPTPPTIPAHRIAILMPNWLGDAVMATPFLRALRSLYLDAHLTAIARPLVAPVLNGLPFINDLHIHPKGDDAQLARWLKSQKFDLGILLPNSFRSAWTLWRSRIPRRLGYARDRRSLLLTDRLTPIPRTGIQKQLDTRKEQAIHAAASDLHKQILNLRVGSNFQPLPTIEYYLNLAAYLRTDPPNPTDPSLYAGFSRKMQLAITPEEKSEAQSALQKISNFKSQISNFVVLIPGANFGASKCYPPDRFAQVADLCIQRHHATILLAGSPAELPILESILQSARHKDRIHSLASLNPPVSLGALKQLIRQSRLVLCNDTGPRHFAAAFNIPTVTLFGPTDPIWAETFHSRERQLRIDVPCGPCQLKTCPIDHRCMTGISIDRVMAAIDALWQNDPVCAPFGTQMKIALVIEHFDATRGGAEAFAVWLASRLAEAQHEVHVVCHDVAARINRYRAASQRASHDADRSHRAHINEETLPPDVHIHRIRGMKLNSALGFRLFGRSARLWCRLHRPDITHSISVAHHGDIYHSQAGVYAEMQAQAVASRTSNASANFKRLLLKLPGKQRTLLTLERHAMRPPPAGASRIVSISGMMTQQLLAHYALDRRRIIELPNPNLKAPNPAQWDESQEKEERNWFRVHYNLRESDRVAAFVGHDFRRKGLRFAIDAIARSTTGWKLLVVGLGKAREYVEHARRLGIGEGSTEPRILFIGPTREVDSVFAASDALLLPTFYDSFGLVALEAFSHGLPVISTELLGAAYLVKQHQAGTIVHTPRDVLPMAAALDALPPRGTHDWEQLSTRARKAGEGISPKHYMEQLFTLYDAVRTSKSRHGT